MIRSPRTRVLIDSIGPDGIIRYNVLDSYRRFKPVGDFASGFQKAEPAEQVIVRLRAEIVVLRDMLYRNLSSLMAQIPYAPQDHEAETPFDCALATMNVLQEIRDAQNRSEDGWRGSAEGRFAAIVSENGKRDAIRIAAERAARGENP